MHDDRSTRRVDFSGRAFAGSQRWIQHHINSEGGQMLASVVARELNLRSSDIEWTSPLAAEGYLEYRDGAFLRAIGQPDAHERLGRFWPRRGPCWDALGRVRTPEGPGALLIEAKSYPGEVLGSGCQAGPKSMELITRSLSEAKVWFEADSAKDWLGEHYQFANRLAHLYFLRELCRVPAWLVNVYFVNDPRKPTSEASWKADIELTKAKLGVGLILPHVVDVFLEASPA